MISFITCQSSMLRLPGSCCSTVTLTSFGISRAQVAKKMAGFGPSRLDHRLTTFFGPNFAEAFSAGFLRDLRKVERDEDGRPKARYVPALNEMRLRLDLTRNQPNAAATMAPLNVAKPPVDNRHPGI
jgi:hypothetical protein